MSGRPCHLHRGGFRLRRVHLSVDQRRIATGRPDQQLAPHPQRLGDQRGCLWRRSQEQLQERDEQRHADRPLERHCHGAFQSDELHRWQRYFHHDSRRHGTVHVSVVAERKRHPRTDRRHPDVEFDFHQRLGQLRRRCERRLRRPRDQLRQSHRQPAAGYLRPRRPHRQLRHALDVRHANRQLSHRRREHDHQQSLRRCLDRATHLADHRPVRQRRTGHPDRNCPGPDSAGDHLPGQFGPAGERRSLLTEQCHVHGYRNRQLRRDKPDNRPAQRQHIPCRCNDSDQHGDGCQRQSKHVHIHRYHQRRSKPDHQLPAVGHRDR